MSNNKIKKDHPLYYRGKASTRAWIHTRESVPECFEGKFENLADPSWVVVQRRSQGMRLGTQTGYSKTYYEWWQHDAENDLYYIYTSHWTAVLADKKYYKPKVTTYTCTCGDFKFRKQKCKHIRYIEDPLGNPKPPNFNKYQIIEH